MLFIHPTSYKVHSRKFAPLGDAQRIQRYVKQDDQRALERMFILPRQRGRKM